MQAADGIKKEDVFHNSNLFSNHYLESMIQKSAEWGDESGLAEAYDRIRDKFFEKEKNLPCYVEAELEHNWVRPCWMLWATITALRADGRGDQACGRK